MGALTVQTIESVGGLSMINSFRQDCNALVLELVLDDSSADLILRRQSLDFFQRGIVSIEVFNQCGLRCE